MVFDFLISILEDTAADVGANTHSAALWSLAFSVVFFIAFIVCMAVMAFDLFAAFIVFIAFTQQ
jgi:hypothetical protein